MGIGGWVGWMAGLWVLRILLLLLLLILLLFLPLLCIIGGHRPCLIRPCRPVAHCWMRLSRRLTLLWGQLAGMLLVLLGLVYLGVVVVQYVVGDSDIM